MNTDTCCRAVPCDQSIAELPRYYARQLITADDLTLEQDYFRSRLRMHNRLLHGWGVVCGADVCYVAKTDANGITRRQPWLVIVTPGYILGPYGDEIYIDCKRTIDVRTHGVVGISGEPCIEDSDPWCSEICDDGETRKVFIGVRYKQFATRPVRVQPVSCGCDDNRCENSRWRDGYEIRILTECPDPGAQPPSLDGLFAGPTPDCTDCPDQPWVVLASVEIGDGGNLTINHCDCRRLAATFMNFWWACTPEAEEIVELTDEEKKQVIETAAELRRNPDKIAYIVGYGTFAGEDEARAEKARNELLATAGPTIDPDRVVTVYGGCRKESLLQFSVLEATADAPTPIEDDSTVDPCPPRMHKKTMASRGPAEAREDTGMTSAPPRAAKRPQKKPGKKKQP